MSWEQVQCHTSVRRAVYNSSVNGMMQTTTIIFGQPGAGQSTIALALAKTLQCKEVDHDFCGQCRTCKLISVHKLPDVFELKPDGVNYKVQQIRDMQTHAVLHPYECDLKVFILHDCHRMNAESFNTLLKTLEEPYPHTVYILETDTLSGVLPTIQSRCRKLRIPSQPLSEISSQFQSNLSADQAETIARYSGGLLEQAQLIMDQDFFTHRNEVLDALQSLLKNEAYVSVMVNLFNPTGKAKDKQRDQLRMRLTILLSLLRDAVCYSSQTPNPVYIHVDRYKEYSSLWKNHPASHWITSFEKTMDTIEGINRYLNMNAQLTDLFISIQQRPQ